MSDLKLLQVCRIFSFIGIVALLGCMWNTCSYFIWAISLIFGFVFMLVALATTKEIARIKSSNRVVKILDNILQEMKDEGVTKISDLKRNKK